MTKTETNPASIKKQNHPVGMEDYQSPQITIIEFMPEKGFASSTGSSGSENLNEGTW